MIGQLSGANSSPALRVPTYTARFGGGGAGGIPGFEAADPWQRSLVSMTVESGLAPFVDVVEILLSADDQAPSVAMGDTGTVSLGYQDSAAEPVFSGQVEDVRYSVGGVTRMTAANGGASLSRLRINQSYEQQSAGDVVSDLAGQAGVSTGTVEGGVDFAFYVVDDRRTVYQQIAVLARKSGYLAYFDPGGDLNFGPFVGGQPAQTFTYGEDILALQLSEATPVLGAVEVVGEGAAGSEGQEAWSWLVKDPAAVTGRAGEGAPTWQVQDPALRSADAAQSAAQASLDAVGLTRLTGRLLVPGAPAVTAGSAIEIADAPQDSLNGLCLVRHVRHRLSKGEGFTTLITFSKTDGGGLSSIGGLF